ncbi:GNAT family N-acetyltransferase [Vagococcus sp. BWB3-3]|uniref:GNAT family N-acetyltransferase n=1 Tax=Vagococcus allomyrinae TaxID=2794353 RepID=A0A940SVI4_9ENTE|nr:GNAT family N-acetyltransferase [Vagococcus allomyrinae]MBP1042375.1 GNAT family N-acetyltransferase [Vagococcus allomyrinae]
MVKLVEITWENFWDTVNIKLNEQQQVYVPSVAIFLSQGYVNLKLGYPAACLGITLNGKIIGFTKIVFMPAKTEPHFFLEDSYFIDAFIIDSNYQSKGHGSMAFEEVIKYIRTAPFGTVKSIKLACHKQNDQAKYLYEKYEFMPTKLIYPNNNMLEIYEKK